MSTRLRFFKNFFDLQNRLQPAHRLLTSDSLQSYNLFIFQEGNISVIYLSIWLSVGLSFCLSTHPPIHPSIHPSIHGSTTLVNLGHFLSSLIYTQSVGLLGRGISPPQGRYLHTGQLKQNKRSHTFISREELEPTTPVFQRAKTAHALDRAATVIGCYRPTHTKWMLL
jgi:hypothetical protein